MDVLERTFILEKTSSWSPYVRSPLHINKKHKYHYIDSSIAVAILGVTPNSGTSTYGNRAWMDPATLSLLLVNAAIRAWFFVWGLRRGLGYTCFPKRYGEDDSP